ncbi:PREDICTED: cytochrome P450 6B1-like [Papilio polytes]|uniref:cytochrome P450 6B1-like n=1 Tax=Papilio polytes TaxID=76194 RepID=UPI00067625B4|nr:PREDICTED: cytochrome P450 6B1-like [Papilio polytes]
MLACKTLAIQCSDQIVSARSTNMMFILVSIAACIAALYYYFTRTFDYWKKKNVVGPKPLPFFGNLKDSFLRKKTLIVVQKSIYDAYPEEKVVGIYRMTTPTLMLRDLDIIKHVLVKDFEQFIDRGVEFSDKGMGANLFHADGERWRVLRGHFTPVFTSGKLKNMLYLMTARADKFIQHIDTITQQQSEQSLHQLFQKYTMSVISACAFGVDLDDKMMDTLEKMDKLIFSANYSIELDMMYPGILKKFNGSLVPRYVTKFFENLVKQVIKQRGGRPTGRKDFMDLILELRQQKTIEGRKRFENENQPTLELTDSIIAAQAFIFYGAGYESSASTMAFMLYEMARNPDIQDKVIKEIDDVLKRNNGEVSYECLNEMTYLHQVFDETLRMYPLADLIQRVTHTEYKLPGTDITLEKGRPVIISAWGIQHDPKYYPDPERFDPERFSAENVKNRHPCAYLPFGAGPRNCIGMRFAKTQSRVGMAKFFSKFRVEPSKKTATNFTYDPMRVFLLPEEGIYVNIVPR